MPNSYFLKRTPQLRHQSFLFIRKNSKPTGKSKAAPTRIHGLAESRAVSADRQLGQRSAGTNAGCSSPACICLHPQANALVDVMVKHHPPVHAVGWMQF